MGPLWSQGLEAISVSYDALGKTGIEGSQRERHCLERLRKDMLPERLDRRESEEKALLEELLRNFCQYRMPTRM